VYYYKSNALSYLQSDTDFQDENSYLRWTNARVDDTLNKVNGNSRFTSVGFRVHGAGRFWLFYQTKEGTEVWLKTDSGLHTRILDTGSNLRPNYGPMASMYWHAFTKADDSNVRVNIKQMVSLFYVANSVKTQGSCAIWEKAINFDNLADQRSYYVGEADCSITEIWSAIKMQDVYNTMGRPSEQDRKYFFSVHRVYC
jgi:hypothetical protein